MTMTLSAHQDRTTGEQFTKTSTSFRDLPVAARHSWKGIQSGTLALLTSLPCANGGEKLVHVAWRTLAHDQPSEVMTQGDATNLFGALSAW